MGLVVAVGPVAQAQTQLIRQVEVKADPIAPLPRDAKDASKSLPGTGLCGGYRASTAAPGSFLPYRDASFPNGGGPKAYEDAVNGFMDGVINHTGEVPTAYQTLQKPFDLAAQKVSFGASSGGDYLGTPACGGSGNPGCAFPASPDAKTTNPDFMTPFLSRFRGFFAVTDNLVGQVIHFGFTVNTTVSMRFYAQTPMPGGTPTVVEYLLISRQSIGAPEYRTTNGIKFTKAGLYAVEILYASFADSARLELAWTTSDLVDFDERSTMGTSALQTRAPAFQLTTAEQFFLRADGGLSFPGMPDTCQQCPRSYAGTTNQPTRGGNGCPSCMACNEAATCQVCNTPDHCGCDTCGPCPDATPLCTGSQGDPSSLHCVECVVDTDCKNGQTCTADNKCVGFCPCCDSPLKCVNTYDGDIKKGAAKNCSECATSSDCPDNGYCDLKNARCLPKAPEHNEDNNCGLNAVNCPVATKDEAAPRNYCLNGEVCVQCRFDVDCARGSYCRSGDCIPCTDDKHCGPSCGSCGVQFAFDGTGMMTGSSSTSTPVCFAPPAPNDRVPAPTPTCVECLTNSHCGVGGVCDGGTHTCSKRPTCDPECPAGQVCSGGGCVECITSSQCRCGSCTAGLCTKSCGDSSECAGTQCCAQETQTCTSGRCKPGLTAHGGALCCDTTAGGISAMEDPGAPVRSRAPLWTLLATLAMFAALRLRTLRPGGRRGVGSGE